MKSKTFKVCKGQCLTTLAGISLLITQLNFGLKLE